jgi:hypothetical protein
VPKPTKSDTTTPPSRIHPTLFQHNIKWWGSGADTADPPT